MKYLVFTWLLFSFNPINAQNKQNGIVVNEETNEPLAFVNITFNNNPNKGVISDIDGRFSYTTDEKITSIQLSYIGFEKKDLKLEGKTFLEISLKPSTDELETVMISTENPALAIIRKVIDNKNLNDPNKIPQFTHKSYNKTIFDIIPSDKKVDSAFNSVFKGGHMFVMESVTEKKFIAPRLTQETIIGNKVSGFKNPLFASLATDIQPFTFYDETIELLDIHFLNPISDGALNKYDYRLKETLFTNGNTIYLITFQPKEGKNFEGLKGVLYINKNKYALQNVIASPAEEMQIGLKIQQQYQLLENNTWFPEQLNYEMRVTSAGKYGQTILVNGKSYIDQVNLNPELTPKDFSVLAVKLEEEATKKDSIFWQNYRVEQLSEKDQITYKVMDSLGEKYKFDKALTYFSKLPEGKLAFGKIDLDLTKTFIYNKHEGNRLGTGLYTNDSLIKNLSVGGYFGYGLQDYEWKYGLDATYTFSYENEFYLKAGYRDDIKEIGSYGLQNSTKLFNGLRDYIIEKVDHIQQYEIATGFRTWKYLKVKLELNHAKITPLKNYTFETPNYNFTPFHNSTAGIELRYAYNEKLIQSFNRNLSMGTNFPVFTFKFTKGLERILDGDWDYEKYEARIEQSIFLKNFGETTYRIQGGYIDQTLPIGLLFTGEGSYDKDLPYVMENTFQTMRPYEFLSDTYLDFFFHHNFGSLLLKEGKFNPEIIVHHNLGWGKLNNNANLFNFNSKEHLFLEAGLELGKIFQLNYLDVAYFNFGAGGFYRYGAYNLGNFEDDFAFKLNLGFSFN